MHIHILFCSAQSIGPDGKTFPTAALALSLDEDVQQRCAGFVQTEIERYAEELESESPRDDDSDSDKSGSDSEQENSAKTKKGKKGKGKEVAKSPAPGKSNSPHIFESLFNDPCQVRKNLSRVWRKNTSLLA